MSLCTVVRLGRPNAGEDDISAGCARDALLPVPPVVGSSSAGAGDMDAEVDGLRLGCSFALFLQWRTLCERLVEIRDCVGWQFGELGSEVADSEETSICPLCDGSDHRGGRRDMKFCVEWSPSRSAEIAISCCAQRCGRALMYSDSMISVQWNYVLFSALIPGIKVQSC